MEFQFYKYQGTGNDFVIIDNRSLFFSKNDTKFIKLLCDRRFGIGADGLILLEEHPETDFKMVYFNANGSESSMCGNGGRCLVHFVNHLGLISSETVFEAVDGLHKASIDAEGVVYLKMKEVEELKVHDGNIFLDTGSPHHITLCEDLDNLSVQQEGARLRYGLYGKEGANINFVKPLDQDVFAVRTYERGVEAETLSCGTGVTAVALAMHHTGKAVSEYIKLITPGGDLAVAFKKEGNRYTDIYLIGKATLVFKGTWK